MKKPDATLRFGSRTVEVSNLRKVFYPQTGFTKGDVIEYYRAISDVLLPHLKGRAVTLKRYPNGVSGKFFYEKQCPRHRPEWLRTVAIPRKRDGKEVAYCLLDSSSALIWAANLANLELHVSLACARNVQRPTSLVFDLDPGEGTDILGCADVSLRLRALLGKVGLESVVKTSGSKGLQLYVPLNTKVSYDETKPFAHALALHLEQESPSEVTSTMKKAERGGKVFIDWSQNDDHKTTVCVYSLRAKTRPTASTPVAWSELRRACRKGSPDALVFDAADVRRRIERKGDLFEAVLKQRQALPPKPIVR